MENRPIVMHNPNPRDRVEPGERYVLETLAESPLRGWTIYEQPNLNGDKPDIIMVNPKRGVVIIEIKDYEITSGKYRPVSQVKGTNGNWIKKTNPVDQVNRYRDEIQRFCSRYFIDLLEEHNQKPYVFGIIETAVYFHNAPASEAEKFCGEYRGGAKILDRSNIEAIKNGDWGKSGLFSINLNKGSKFTSIQLERFVKDLETWLKPSSYQLEGARAIALFPDQKQHAKPTPNLHRRLKGVAGSGKTLVLATRAARLLEENQRVLVVPFNITLKHYLRDTISRQFEGDDRRKIRDNLVIRHFHDLLKMIAMDYDIELASPRFDTDDVLTNVWPAQVLNCLRGLEEIDEKYLFDAILVDEGQDYCQEWVELLLMLLKERDEFLITYDNVQDIYQRNAVWIEDKTKVSGLGFRGRPASLNITRRVPGPMIKVAQEFAERYKLPQKNEVLVPKQWDDLFVTLQWKNTSNHNPCLYKMLPPNLQVLNQVEKFISSGVSPDDITILTTNQDTGLSIVQTLKELKMKVCHVFDESGNKNYRVRREEKWKFQPGTGKIKVCTVHSFKGWESTHLILVLDQLVTNRPPLIYVALTRFKHPIEGAESYFICLNFDPAINGVKELFDKYGNNLDSDNEEHLIALESNVPVHGTQNANNIWVPQNGFSFENHEWILPESNLIEVHNWGYPEPNPFEGPKATPPEWNPFEDNTWVYPESNPFEGSKAAPPEWNPFEDNTWVYPEPNPFEGPKAAPPEWNPFEDNTWVYPEPKLFEEPRDVSLEWNPLEDNTWVYPEPNPFEEPKAKQLERNHFNNQNRNNPDTDPFADKRRRK